MQILIPENLLFFFIFAAEGLLCSLRPAGLDGEQLRCCQAGGTKPQGAWPPGATLLPPRAACWSPAPIFGSTSCTNKYKKYMLCQMSLR